MIPVTLIQFMHYDSELFQKCELVVLMHSLSRANTACKLDQFQSAYLHWKQQGFHTLAACEHATSDCGLTIWHGWN